MIYIAKKKGESFPKTWDGRLSKLMRDFEFTQEQRKSFIEIQKEILDITNLNDEEKYRLAYKEFKPMLERKLNIAHEIAQIKENVKNTKTSHVKQKPQQKLFVAF